MQIKIFVARFMNTYSIALSADLAEENMLDIKKPLTTPYVEETLSYPDLNSRGDCMDFAQEAMNAFKEREELRAKFHAEGSMISCPVGVTHVWVDDMGCVRWDGGPVGVSAVEYKWSADTVPSWTPVD